jgi:2-octaprenyl-6-methoxyphenol hydroxylase
LPLSPVATSVVWSVKNKSKTENIILNEKNKLEFLQNITAGIYDKIKVASQIESFPLTFNFLSKIALFRTIFVGDITHKIHPIAGQGWNMSLRDIDDLRRILKEKLSKGYDIGAVEVLQEFEKKTKLSNLLFAVSIDLVRRAFRSQSSSIKKVRKKTFSIVSQPTLMNKIIDIADKGLRI